jgi:hypothetical protein
MWNRQRGTSIAGRVVVEPPRACLLSGLADAGVDLGAADLVIGTSAGSIVGAQLTTGQPLADRIGRHWSSRSA